MVDWTALFISPGGGSQSSSHAQVFLTQAGGSQSRPSPEAASTLSRPASAPAPFNTNTGTQQASQVYHARACRAACILLAVHV